MRVTTRRSYREIYQELERKWPLTSLQRNAAVELASAVRDLGTKSLESFEGHIALQDFDVLDRLARRFLELIGKKG